MGDRGGSTIAERAAAILRQEVADGALANIATSSSVWSASRLDLLSAASRARAELEDMAAVMLDLLTPPPRARELRARLRNDGDHAVDMGLTCSDLVTDAGQRIPTTSVLLAPDRLRLLPGAEADITIRVHVPNTAVPGLYRGLLGTTSSNGPRALVRFQIA